MITPPESKTQTAAMAVTPREKKRMGFVCGADNTTESELIRKLVMPYVDARHAELIAQLQELAEQGKRTA